MSLTTSHHDICHLSFYFHVWHLAGAFIQSLSEEREQQQQSGLAYGSVTLIKSKFDLREIMGRVYGFVVHFFNGFQTSDIL
jgi:hypothetical protein